MMSNKAHVISAGLVIEWDGNHMGLAARKPKFESQLYHLLTISSFKKRHLSLKFLTYKMGGQNMKIIHPSSLLGKINKIVNMKWLFKYFFKSVKFLHQVTKPK